MLLCVNDSSVKFKEVFWSLSSSRTIQIGANNFSWRIQGGGGGEGTSGYLSGRGKEESEPMDVTENPVLRMRFLTSL